MPGLGGNMVVSESGLVWSRFVWRRRMGRRREMPDTTGLAPVLAAGKWPRILQCQEELPSHLQRIPTLSIPTLMESEGNEISQVGGSYGELTGGGRTSLLDRMSQQEPERWKSSKTTPGHIAGRTWLSAHWADSLSIYQ